MKQKITRRSQTQKNPQTGFTTIELLVGILVAGLFIVIFYQLFTSLVQLNSSARRDASANDLAFSNLRRYTDAESVGLTSCPGDSASPTTPRNISNTVDSDYPELGKVSEKITASCTNSSSGSAKTVYVLSEVTYNGGTSKASYATYVN